MAGKPERLTGAEAALCALSFFRHRHDRVRRFKNATRPHNQRQTVRVDRDQYVSAARDYIRQARIGEFRGSFLEAAREIGAV